MNVDGTNSRIRLSRMFGCVILGVSLCFAPGLQAQDKAEDKAEAKAPSPSAVDSVVAAASCAAPTACDASAACAGCDACCDSGSCNLGDPFELFGESCGVTRMGGWLQFGYHSENNGLFNSHPDRFNAQQLWLYIEKEAKGECEWDFGYRADIMYGVDAADTQAFGNPAGEWDLAPGFQHGGYGWAIPQLYLSLQKDNWTINAGHFFTLRGYEVVTAPDNFFYSHAYTMYNSEPFTHTGVIATYDAGEGKEYYAGWTAGWDTGFARVDRGSTFIGGASVPVGDKTTLTYITTIGDFGLRGEGYSHSLVADVAVSDKLNYVLQTDLLEGNGNTPVPVPGAALVVGDHQWGLNQYLLYTINDCVKAGGRFEIWHNSGMTQNALTFGVNIRPHANIVLRPELRHDWNPSTDVEFTTAAIDVILSF